MKIVLRLMAGDGSLLGWAATEACLRGDGGVWPIASPIAIPVERAGRIAALNTAWPELGVNVSVPCDAEAIPGQPFVLTPGDAPLMQFASSEPSLPAVTERAAVAVDVPVGMVGAK